MRTSNCCLANRLRSTCNTDKTFWGYQIAVRSIWFLQSACKWSSEDNRLTEEEKEQNQIQFQEATEETFKEVSMNENDFS